MKRYRSLLPAFAIISLSACAPEIPMQAKPEPINPTPWLKRFNLAVLNQPCVIRDKETGETHPVSRFGKNLSDGYKAELGGDYHIKSRQQCTVTAPDGSSCTYTAIDATIRCQAAPHNRPPM